MAVSAKPEKAAVVKRPFRTSFTMKRTNDWVLATDVPSDVVVIVGGVSFALHKFPLVSRCGRIRMLVVEAGDSDVSQMELPDVPGGAEGFDMAARFCYGINFEITTANVAVLRCAAEYLEMTEEYGEGNLVARTEAFLSEVVCQNLADSITVLHNCENLLPYAEELKIVSRTIDAIASKACREQIAQGMGESDYDISGRNDSNVKLSFSKGPQKVTPSDWWAEDLAVLRIDFYQRVLAAMRSRGLRYESIGGALMHYAHRSLKGLHRKQTGRDMYKGGQQKKVHDSTSAIEHEQRILVETIVSLLPPEKNTASCSFLFGLLRTAIILDTTIACRLDLERRIGQQLEQATLDDLLIPSFSYTGDTLFDVDIVQRIIVCFLQQTDNEDVHDPHSMYESDGMGSPTQSALMKVAKLLDSYLAEIAPDANLKLAKFISLAELLPEYARVVDDGLYRAIDIYLKAHPSLTEIDRKKLCKLMDVQKLSQEACTHAAQNERLPVQIMVQVLYFEQLRLRTAMTGSLADVDHVGHNSQRISGAFSSAVSPRDNYASVRRENRELKLEVARMRMRLTDLEKDHVCMKQDLEKGGGQKTFLQSVSKKLTRLNPFSKSGIKGGALDSKAPNTPDSRQGGSGGRRRRHSIS
ncbi:protein MpNCH1 [Marchantia polymorpha subsp. ruderalis]|uniref:BTB/POZ domain-containing protein n=2 Tax=Marchantia polymorpha TaxID=3197 RepID=A0AAF6BFS9_MARPO|nr:hypothetical protein MARPO_0136s0015 [Marchantia polymorpha]BAV53280.1 non-phototropic hypocotyl 3-like protein [Marchantia polymorpha]BAV53281.1 non-phototropic hypocotyl 3-like protein [Marchantia polymorpha]BBN10863.1 hypothetical protein Mp_5g07060 [Marchantia polymorpha subsp. ruderalis]|eukprot:PTQ29687.1 hypothetical protein MARPO_0136s0015 [Marchantia polymorpha]